MWFLNSLSYALLVLLSSSSSSASEKDDYQFALPDYSHVLTKSVLEIMLKYFQKPVCIVWSSDPAEPSNGVLQSDIVNEIVYKAKSQVLLQLDSAEFIHHNLDYRRDCNIFFVDDYKSFRRIYEQINSLASDYNGYYLIIITGGTWKLKQDFSIQNILNDFWKLHIVNVIILVNKSSSVSIFTYFPYTKDYCGEVHPQDMSNNTFTKTFNYFPTKLDNFYKCKLIVATLFYPPFMTYEELGDDRYAIGGIEGALLLSLSERLNFTFTLKISAEKWGILTENGTATGVSKMVMSGEANLTIGNMRVTPVRNKFMTSSKTYFTSQLLFVVPPGESFTPMEKLLLPFKRYIWLSLALLCASCVGGILLLEKCASRQVRNFVLGRNIQTPSINFLNVILGNSLHVLPQRNFSRTIVVIWILAFLVIRTSYQGSLFSCMRDNQNKSVAVNINDMLQRGYYFFMNKNTMMFLEDNPRMLRRTLVNNDFEFKEKLRSQIVRDPSAKYAIMEAAECVAWMNKNTSNQLFQHTAQEHMATMQLAIYFAKSSCLATAVNEELSKLISNGLLQHWTMEYVEYRHLLPPKPSTDPQVLTLEELAASFQILCFGYAIAFMAFIGELLHKFLLFYSKYI